MSATSDLQKGEKRDEKLVRGFEGGGGEGRGGAYLQGDGHGSNSSGSTSDCPSPSSARDARAASYASRFALSSTAVALWGGQYQTTVSKRSTVA